MQDIFNSDGGGHDTTCQRLSEDHSVALAMEAVSVSALSPCVVANVEYIARQIHSPIHLDPDGKLTPGFFSDAFDKGLSSNRLSYITEEQLHQAGESKAERDRLTRNPDREYVGFAVAQVGEIRAVTEDDISKLQVFGVYDSALTESVDHADVCSILPMRPVGNLSSKAAKAARRDALRTCFLKVVLKP